MILIEVYSYEYRSRGETHRAYTFDPSCTPLVGFIESPDESTFTKSRLNPARLVVHGDAWGQVHEYLAPEAVEAAKAGKHGLRWRPND